MGILYLASVGTSILRNFAEDRDYASIVAAHEHYGIRDWWRLGVEDLRNSYPDGLLCQVFKDDSFRSLAVGLESFVDQKPKASSAELNTIYSLMEKRGHRPGDIEVKLLSPRTCNAGLSATLIKRHMERAGFRGVEIEVLGEISAAADFPRLLIELKDTVGGIVRNHKDKGDQVYVIATAGYKPESAALAITALIHGADEVAYMHEAFKEVVTIPREIL